MSVEDRQFEGDEPIGYAAAEGGAMAVTAAPPVRKRRTSIASRGEPMVWLCGGCVAVAVLMIVVLLAFVAVRGFSTFWPSPVERVALLDDTFVVGEPTRTSTFYDNEDVDGDEEVDAQLPISRTLYKTGNFPLSDTSFAWVRDDKVRDKTRPGELLTVEWRDKGSLFGELVAVSDGETRVEGFDAALAQLHAWHAVTEAFNDEIDDIAEGELGEIQVERTKMRRRLDEAIYLHGKDSAQVRQVRAENEDREAGLAERAGKLGTEIRRLRAERDKYRVELRAGDGTIRPDSRGEELPLRLAQVTRFYPANQLSLGDKLGLYLGRWGEFLTEDPRQANSEGGVWPAIVGTVMLTFLMVLLVVPLGVIAAIYLREYARQGLLTSLVRISVNNLAGVPSIVYGVFGLGFFCYTLGGWIDGGPRNVGASGVEPLSNGMWLLLLAITLALLAGAIGLGLVSTRVGRSDKVQGLAVAKLIGFGLFALWTATLVFVGILLLKVPFFDGLYPALAASGSPVLKKGAVLWASLTLALLTLPVVIVATEEAISAVPKSMREGSYACGASKWQTIRRIVLPRALPGIMTGAILAIARGAGEVAPIMLVGALVVGGTEPFDLSDNPITGTDGWFGLNRSFQHLGLNIYGLGFQSPDSEAARPLLFTTVLLLIGIVVVLNVTAILIRSRLRRTYAGGAF